MTDLDRLLSPTTFIRPSNGCHAIASPRATGEPIELPDGFWRGCNVEGNPLDPRHPWFWSTSKGDA